MSRNNDGTPVPMSTARRADITRGLSRIMDVDAPFPGERLVVSCIRYDGDFCELVSALELTSTGIVVHLLAKDRLPECDNGN